MSSMMLALVLMCGCVQDDSVDVKAVLQCDEDVDRCRAAFERLLSSTALDAKHSLLTIVAGGPTNYAYSSAIYLLRVCNNVDLVDLAGVVDLSIVKWEEDEKRGFLSEVRNYRQGSTFVTTARLVLSDHLARTSSDKFRNGTGSSIDEAALMLSSQPVSEEDKNLISRMVDKFPASYGLWVSIARCGLMDEGIRTLAGQVYRDPKIAIPVRVAAASTIALVSSEAHEFVVERLKQFVHDYGGLLKHEIVGPEVSGGRSAWAARRMEYEEGFRTLGVCQLLDDKSAKDILVEVMRVENPAIRQLAAMIFYDRWPAESATVVEAILDPSELGNIKKIISPRMLDRGDGNDSAMAGESGGSSISALFGHEVASGWFGK